MKEMLYAVRCLKSNEDMILALAGQFKQLTQLKERLRGTRKWPIDCISGSHAY